MEKCNDYRKGLCVEITHNKLSRVHRKRLAMEVLGDSVAVIVTESMIQSALHGDMQLFKTGSSVANQSEHKGLTYALLRVDGKFVDEEFAKWCCERNMEWADSNFFVSDSVSSLSNCCRLKSNITDLG